VCELEKKLANDASRRDGQVSFGIDFIEKVPREEGWASGC
jgi:hypothetical protein